MDRTDTETMLALAEAYQRRGHRLQARRQVGVLLEQDPDHHRARELLILLYLTDRQMEAARAELDELTRRDPGPMIAARCTAMVRLMHDRDTEAYRAALLEAVDQHAPDADTWVAIGESYDDFQQEQAAEAFRHALALHPGHEDAVRGLIHADRRLLLFEEAVQRLRAKLPRRPNRHAWRHALIELYWIVQDYASALALSEAGAARTDVDASTTTRYRLQLLATLRLADRLDEATEHLEEWAAAETGDPDWTVRLASTYLALEQPAKAVALYEELFRSLPDDRQVLAGLLDALQEASQDDRACQFALDWFWQDPDSDLSLALLVSVLASAERVDQALELAHNRLLRTPDRERFQDVITALLNLAERHDEAVEWIESLLDEIHAAVRRAREPGAPLAPNANPKRPNPEPTVDRLHLRLGELRESLARALILDDEAREAERSLSDWLSQERDPRIRFGFLMSLAYCHQRLGKEREAENAQVRALAMQPDSVGLNNDVAYGWISLGIRLDQAEPMIRYALARAPREPAYLDTFGWLLYKKGAFAEAKKWLARAVGARTGGDPVIHDHLGDTCWRLGLADEARKHWNLAAELVREQTDEELVSHDERRVRAGIEAKIQQARSGGEPKVAPLKAPEPDIAESDDQQPATDPAPTPAGRME